MLETLNLKVAFTGNCNLICGYCGGSRDRKSWPVPGKMEDYRAEPISSGNINTNQLLELLFNFRRHGFEGIRPTGGEPTLRQDWDTIVDKAAEMGFKGVDITTNGTTLTRYLSDHDGKLPKGLSTVKVSLDTCDPDEFRQITGGGDLNKVVSGIEAITDQVWVRANTVILRSNCKAEKISKFLDFCHKIGMKQVQFLDLVYYPNLPGADPKFWENEFVAWPEFLQTIKTVYPDIKFDSQVPELVGAIFHSATLKNGLVVTFKDSTSTSRDSGCNSCPVYCQEGRCLIRIGTDGNVTFCPDYEAKLWHFNGPKAIKDGTFDKNIEHIRSIVETSQRTQTIETFATRHNLRLPKMY
jgi:molybdenum cofactor biosynthesis enzyme MoaA